MLTMLPRQNLANMIEVAALGPDDLSDVRYVHATAFRLQAKAFLRLEEIQAFTDYVYTSEYLNKLAAEDLHAAWIGQELVGTAGWTAIDHKGCLARIRSVFVRPLFTGLGIGRHLVREAEGRANKAGFTAFSVRAPINSVGFFERMGFGIRSHGVHTVSPIHDIPVRFMRKDKQTAQHRKESTSTATNAADGDASEDVAVIPGQAG